MPFPTRNVPFPTRPRRHRSRRWAACVVAFALGIAGATAVTSGSAALAAGPVGSGFTVTASDLAFILKQIKIAESHAATFTPENPCGTLVATSGDGIPDELQIPDRLTAFGLRTVDGSCNNLFPGRERFAAADQVFPRLTDPVFRAADPITAALPVGAPGPTSYAQKRGNVVDAAPRLISNLIVDQTSTNPAAVAAAAFPVRAQAGATGVFACTADPSPADPNGTPDGCVPSHQTLFIENVTTDVGLSPPYNSWFTFFGQFFDHGVDQTVKSGSSVFVPLRDDDPLVAGPDHVAGNADDLPPSLRFMVLTRAQNQPGRDGVLGDNPATPADESADDIQEATNTDSPWIDQSQTYTSHASHQVFLREYAMNTANKPVSTGRLLGGLDAGQTYSGSPDGREGISTWKSVKEQARTKLGLLLTDKDVTNVPMLAVDPYGKFLPGPNGLPQYVTATGLVEGNLASPVPVPANVRYFDTPFLTDIAHNADPSPQDTDHNPATPPVAPVPDADNTPSADFAAQPPGTYDDEMLDAHFACGDGRCNENIALSAVHQIFHSEHDRLVADIQQTLTADTSATGVAALAEWKLADGADGWNGERLFQAARFVTEMEYQHLVFEEFGRKVQPAIRPFHVYSPDIDPAVKAEFAHAVYRFGHSMLDDTVARTTVNPTTGARSDNSLPLLDAFLNPPAFFQGGPGNPVQTPAQAAGSIILGSVDQSGNELDEFMTETLRNNLLGLPLDLATLNLTRARDAGVPPLNEVRRQIQAATNDGQLTPYTNWSDFGQHLKHRESLVNFVAAYGRHPSITGATTMDARRAAARAIVDPLPTDVPPDDASAFMFGTDAWTADAAGRTTTGVDDIDLWVGGLAEVTNLNGGLLGSTFNYVFQTQMEALQDGDRLYYLNRTPGMNLRTQLEGNSFAEMIARNTDGTDSLKADVFATADCKFQLGHLAGTSAGFAQFGSAVADDPATECAENLLLLRQPDGTIQYRATNAVDPAGINGQSVFNGTDSTDRVNGGNDNDTFWGAPGSDVIEGNGGDDVALGGEGNDIVTDLGGADVEKGGPGNDALDGGIGDDIFMGGDGQDVVNGGANDNEAFAGPGNDFAIAGQGADAVFGDGGDDWIQGGSGQDLLIGDHGAPFFDDPGQAAPGNDVFVGEVGENDYDAEGGDDVMAQNAAVDRNAGAAGFDWAFHQYDTVGADDDIAINNNLVGVPVQVVVNRDRWQEVEGDSGSAFDDIIRGTDNVPAAIGGAGFAGCNVLDQAGVDRIAGLSALVPQPLTGDPAPVIANSAAGFCPVVGPIWGDGEILLGGTGSDTITGRGADDIIDGDRSLAVRISVRDKADNTAEIGTTDLLQHQATAGTFGPGTAGKNLQQAVFAGLVDPGQLVPVRQIVTPSAAATAGNIDTVRFAGPLSNYAVTSAGGKLFVTQTGPNVAGQKASDGTDTLTNVERLAFSDQTLSVAPPAAPVIGSATASSGSATVTFTAPPTAGTLPLTGFTVEAVPDGGGTTVTDSIVDETATTITVNGLTNGTTYRLRVAARNALATGSFSALSNPVTPTAVVTPPPTAPDAPTVVSVTPGAGSVTVTFAAPAFNGGSPLTGFTVQAVEAATGTPISEPVTTGPTATSAVVTGLVNGTAVLVAVSAVNAVGTSLAATSSAPVVPVTTPDAPAIGVATAGDGAATVNWTAPANGGSPITGFAVRVVDPAGNQVGALRTAGATDTALAVTGLTNGVSYRFQVRATNAVGDGPFSALSNAVTPITVPGAPTIGTTTAGNAAVTVRWTAPGDTGGSAITGYLVRVVLDGTSVEVGAPRVAGAGDTSLLVTGLAANTAYRFQVAAVNAAGAGAYSAFSAATRTFARPAAPTIGTVTRGNASATVRWTAPTNTGGTPLTGFTVQVVNAATGVQVGLLRTAAATATSLNVTGLTNGTAYRFRVRAVNVVGSGPASALSATVTPATVPGAPGIGTAQSGTAGGAITATAFWGQPAATGGSPITGYRVTALRMSATGTVLATTVSTVQPAGARSLQMTLAAGSYRFTVQAINAVGAGPQSARSNLVTAR